MPPLNCWIIEDEPPALRRLTRLIGRVRPRTDVTFSTDSVAPALRALQTLPHPDVVFSDIHLADGLCFDIWENAAYNRPIIFTTAYDQYGIRAFRVNSIDYLLKPIEEADLVRAFEKLERVNQPSLVNDWSAISALIDRQRPSYRERFLVQQRQEWLPIRVADLRQIYSESGMTFALDRTGKRFLLDDALDRIEEEIDPRYWFRINRKQIVHIDAVRKVSPYFNHRLAFELQPNGEGENIVSRPRVKDCKEWLAG